MGFTAGQLALLEQSYTQLKQSVYDGSAGQENFNGGRREATNNCEWRLAA